MQANQLICALLAILPWQPRQDPAPAPKPEQHQVYDETLDAAKAIDAALVRARAENRRVLVVWGANWCGWCVRLHDLFAKDGQIARKLLYEYDVVSVDVGRFDKHMDLAQGYRAELKGSGIPYLTVLDAAGKVLANQDTGSLEEGQAHDPAKVLGFLTEHQAPYAKAAELRDQALAAAASSGKQVLISFDAPWCIWCKRFEAWLARPRVAAILEQRLVIRKIDVDRTIGGQELCEAYGGKGSGIPWFAFLDASGKTLGTSSESGANLGCPYSPEEIETFGQLVRKALPELADEQVRALQAELGAQREELERARSTH